jgi:hypothetical protein
MENTNELRRWYRPLVRRMCNSRSVLLAGLALVAVLGGLTGLNPFLGVACALALPLLVLVLPRPVLIVYALTFMLPLVGGLARGVGVPFLRLGQALLVVGFILFMLASPSRQGKSRVTGIDLAFMFFFLTEAVFPVLALYYSGEHLDLNSVDVFHGTTPLQTLLGPIQYYLLYRIIVATISSEKQIVSVLKLSFVASIVVSVIGILQKLGVAPVKTFLSTYYPILNLPSFLNVSNVDLRITSTLDNYAGLGAYLAFTIIVALACYSTQKSLKISSLFLTTTIVLDSIALILTGTFAAYIGLTVGAVVVFILVGRVPKLVIFILIGVALTVLIFQPFISGRLDQWLGGGMGEGFLPSYAARIRLWEDLFLPAIGQHLLFGAGPAPEATSLWPSEETQYFALLLRGGLPYFFSYILLMGTSVIVCWRLLKDKGEEASRTAAIATLAILVALNIMNFSAVYFSYVGGTQTIWSLLAIVVASRQFKAFEVSPAAE